MNHQPARKVPITAFRTSVVSASAICFEGGNGTTTMQLQNGTSLKVSKRGSKSLGFPNLNCIKPNCAVSSDLARALNCKNCFGGVWVLFQTSTNPSSKTHKNAPRKQRLQRVNSGSSLSRTRAFSPPGLAT